MGPGGNSTSPSKIQSTDSGPPLPCFTASLSRQPRRRDISLLAAQKYALVDDQWTIPGTTLNSIRKQTDWKCDRTIQRRLSASVRKEHGLEPINKVWDGFLLAKGRRWAMAAIHRAQE